MGTTLQDVQELGSPLIELLSEHPKPLFGKRVIEIYREYLDNRYESLCTGGIEVLQIVAFVTDDYFEFSSFNL